MAKKKQFAGKKTKLAELPLTQILASQAEATPSWDSPLGAPESDSRQLPLSWEGLEAGPTSSLAATYFQVIQDLKHLQSELPLTGTAADNPAPPLPAGPPAPPRLKEALHQTREDLQDLRRMLSQP
jgi:hypothetical protein